MLFGKASPATQEEADGLAWPATIKPSTGSPGAGPSANDPTGEVQIPWPNDHFPGEGKHGEIIGGEDHLPLWRNGHQQFVFFGRLTRQRARAFAMTPADPSGQSGGAGQKRRAADVTGCLFLGRPIALHRGNLACWIGQIQSHTIDLFKMVATEQSRPFCRVRPPQILKPNEYQRMNPRYRRDKRSPFPLARRVNISEFFPKTCAFPESRDSRRTCLPVRIRGCRHRPRMRRGRRTAGRTPSRG